MPELPEVETVRRGLADHVVGRRITRADFLGARVVRRHVPGADDLSSRLVGARVADARRRGKYLWLVLELPEPPEPAGPAEPAGPTEPAGPAGPGSADDVVDDDSDRAALLLHLGMSGQLLVEAHDAPEERHLHARFSFADDGPELRFVDQRTFGGVAYAELGPDGIPEPIAHIAPDPLEAAWDADAVVARMRRRDSAVKRCLLDQSLVSGIGNIYADEALWRAAIHGERPANRLTRPALHRLLAHAQAVMTEALGQGGTSFDALYVNVNGASGYFDRSLDAYGQAGRPCRRCGTPIRREAFMNRSSFSCPHCQPRPRLARRPPEPTARPRGSTT